MISLRLHNADRPIDYEDHNLTATGQPAKNRRRTLAFHLRWPLVFGLLGSLGLMGFYLGIVTLVESWAHALGLFREDAPFVVPIILGFGIQVGLFTYLKRRPHLINGTRTAGTVTGTTGGASTLAMVACCAHHITDVLPLLGLSGAAIFLAQYKTSFMIVGLLSNVASLGVMLAILGRARKRTAFEGGYR